MEISDTDKKYMLRAIELAKNGIGFVNPNPLVGAVIVKNSKIIGEGWHEKYGHLHAERNALKNCTEDPAGADIYVSLEPCCHWGKNPPCTDALIESGIKRVFVGSDDPNPLVAGKGIKILREHGIEVFTHVLKDECDALNDIFFHYITSKFPYVILKYAMTADGKIATYSGKSKWITGEESRKHTHLTRKRAAAIMVGIGTVLADDPILTCRVENSSNPVRVIMDSKLEIPLDSKIMQSAKEVSTIIACAEGNPEKEKAIENCGAKIYHAKITDGKPDIEDVLKYLGSLSLDSCIIEGGGTLAASAIEKGLPDLVQVYIAPKIFGGADAKIPVAGKGFEDPNKCFICGKPEVTILGNDVLIEYRK